MIYTITISISVLVAINFLLLVFSCNKTKKIKNLKSRKINMPIIRSMSTTTQQIPNRLSPTGS